jgi:ABC-type lipoprotein release transport system permease subunit
MSRLVEHTGYPENVVVLADGSNDETFSALPFNETADVDFRPGIAKGLKADGSMPPLCSRELYLVANTPVPPEAGKASGPSLRGKVRKVSVDENVVVLTETDGRERMVRLAEGGRVFANNVGGHLEALRPGDDVWVAYQEQGSELRATEIRGSNKRRFVQVRGIEDPEIAAQVHRIDLEPGGHWFSPAGVKELKKTQQNPNPGTAVEAVIGQGLARELGRDVNKPRLEIDDEFEAGPKKWKVVGILQSEGKTFDSEVWAKRSYLGELFGKPNTVSSIVIRTPSPEDARNLINDLKTNYKKANLAPQTEVEYYSKLTAMTTQLQVGIVFLTFFMAVGGIFGVMNTMFAAISQRTKDIGVLRIVGYSRRQILVSFLLESMVLALVGGLLGCALGSLCNGISATSVVGGQGGFGKTVILRLTVDGNTLGIGLLLTVLMGVVGGLVPALSAMRLKPLESLR